MAEGAAPLHIPSTPLPLPPDWAWRRLDSVCEGIFDCPHSTPALTDDGPLIARSQDVRSGVFVVREAGRVSEDTYRDRTARVGPRHGDLLYSREGTYFGIAAEVPPGTRVCLGQRMVLLRPTPTAADYRFLRYWLNSPVMVPHVRGQRDGTVAERLNLPTIRALPVTLPPLPEQRAIAHILGTLDAKIELNRRMNETLEAMARALFRSWFVDFDPVRAKAEGRDPGLPKPLEDLFPDRFVESEMGEIPEGWEVCALGDVLAELEVGGRPKGGVSEYSEGVPSIGAESIVGLGVFDYSKTKYVPREFYEGMAKGHVKDGDVLLYKDGGRPGEFEPHVAMFGNGFPFHRCAINERVYRLRASDALCQNYLFFWLSSELVMEEMRVKGTGVAIPGLNSTQLKSVTTLAPPRGIVRAFDSAVGPRIVRVLSSCSESRTLSLLRDTLLPKLISGELRAKHPERFAQEAT